MSIVYNGTSLTSISYNGNSIDKVIYNGTEVYTSAPDPTKSSFTQDEFIAICNAGLQSKMKLGALVALNNGYCSTYEVADVNHDGTSSTVDLLAHYQLSQLKVFSNNRYQYSSSEIRSFLLYTYYTRFDNDIKNLIKTMNVQCYDPFSYGTITLQDKVKILSFKEVGMSYESKFSSEGNLYPIFSSGSKWRGSASSLYWLRSTDGNWCYLVNSNGNTSWKNYNAGGYGVLPVLRF